MWYPLNLLTTILPCFDSLWCPIFNTRKEHGTQCLRLTKSACWERKGCQFPLSVVLFFFSAKALEKRRRGARNPLVNDSWDLGHVLNLDTNVGSFYGPSVICFMCLPNIGTVLASLSPLYIHLAHHMVEELDVNAPRVPCTFSHSQQKPCGSIWQDEAVWREMNRSEHSTAKTVNPRIYDVFSENDRRLGKRKIEKRGEGKVIIR